MTCSQLPMICGHGILGASASVMVSFFFGEMWEDVTEFSMKRRRSSAWDAFYTYRGSQTFHG